MTAFLESWGTGVSRMVDACKTIGLPEPEYGTDGGFVWITFKRPNSVIKQVEATSITKNEPINETINETINEPINELLSVRQKDIIAAIRLKPSITREELADITKISLATIKREITTLRNKGYINRDGSNKNGLWILLKGITE